MGHAPFTRGAGLSPNAGSNSFNSAGFTGEATDYVEFGFTVAPGYSVNLDKFQTATRSSNTGPGTMGLYWSGDGFAAPIITISQAPGSNYVNAIYNVSSLTGLTGSVTFRFKAIGTGSANGGTTGSTGTWRIGDYTSDGANFIDTNFSGEIVPAPASVALVGLAGLVAGRRRR